MNGELEIEQRLVDIAEGMQTAVSELSQGIADAVELLGSRNDQRLEDLLTRVSESLSATLKNDQGHKIAQSIVQGIRGIKIQAPDVKVTVEAPTVNVAAAQITVQPAPVQVTPTVEVHVPEQPAPQVTIETAKEWKADFVYDQRGRIVSASMKRAS